MRYFHFVLLQTLNQTFESLHPLGSFQTYPNWAPHSPFFRSNKVQKKMAQKN
ncbi:hypothetical protein Hanom_Chr14g01318941 [Helianthus anomalus]